MGQPPNPCRACLHYRRNKPRGAVEWIRNHGACVLSGKARPAHGNQRGCEDWRGLNKATKKPKLVMVKCARCHGSGEITTRWRKETHLAGSGPFSIDVAAASDTCPVCDGKGKHKTEQLEETP